MPQLDDLGRHVPRGPVVQGKHLHFVKDGLTELKNEIRCCLVPLHFLRDILSGRRPVDQESMLA